MNSFWINSVLVLVVVDLVYIYPLIRYPQTRCSLHHQNQSFQALYPEYLLSSIHLHLVCLPLPTIRLYPSPLTSAHLWMSQESTLTRGKWFNTYLFSSRNLWSNSSRSRTRLLFIYRFLWWMVWYSVSLFSFLYVCSCSASNWNLDLVWSFCVDTTLPNNSFILTDSFISFTYPSTAYSEPYYSDFSLSCSPTNHSVLSSNDVH